MQFKKNIIIATIILFAFSAFAEAESTWIKKKDKSKKVEKVEKKKSSWIKKKIKENKKKYKKEEKKITIENKKEYKKEEKKITKTIKKWIKKKTKDKYIDNINDLPNGAIYFTGYNQTREIIFYGYVTPDTESKLIDGYYQESLGFGFIDDGKTICKVGSEVLIVIDNEVTARVWGDCSNGMKFAGKTTQTQNIGWGSAKTADGKNRLIFDFNINKLEIAKVFEENKIDTKVVERRIKPKEKILLNPKGKYYALLIGNSVYNDEGWNDLVSPVNDINAIKSVLDNSYKFEKIIKVTNGTKKDIYKAFQELSKLTTTNDYVLIYYSGHGQVKAQQAFWIPTDASENWGNGDWINISEIDIFLTDIKAHHLAVLVDSCFVGSRFKGMNIIDDIILEDEQLFGESLASDLTLRSRSVLSSGTSGQVSDTVKGTNHSMFALSIINQLTAFEKKSYPLNLEQIAALMKINYGGSFQKPFMYHPDTWNHGGGDFIFIPKKNLK